MTGDERKKREGEIAKFCALRAQLTSLCGSAMDSLKTSYGVRNIWLLESTDLRF